MNFLCPLNGCRRIIKHNFGFVKSFLYKIQKIIYEIRRILYKNRKSPIFDWFFHCFGEISMDFQEYYRKKGRQRLPTEHINKKKRDLFPLFTNFVSRENPVFCLQSTKFHDRSINERKKRIYIHAHLRMRVQKRRRLKRSPLSSGTGQAKE